MIFVYNITSLPISICFNTINRINKASETFIFRRCFHWWFDRCLRYMLLCESQYQYIYTHTTFNCSRFTCCKHLFLYTNTIDYLYTIFDFYSGYISISDLGWLSNTVWSKHLRDINRFKLNDACVQRWLISPYENVRNNSFKCCRLRFFFNLHSPSKFVTRKFPNWLSRRTRIAPGSD